MKLYYDDIFSASYMAGAFPELSFIDDISRQLVMFSDNGYVRWDVITEPLRCWHEKYEKGKFYLHPDSHAFFEFQENCDCAFVECNDVKEVRIADRDGKAFIMPKMEEGNGNTKTD